MLEVARGDSPEPRAPPQESTRIGARDPDVLESPRSSPTGVDELPAARTREAADGSDRSFGGNERYPLREAGSKHPLQIVRSSMGPIDRAARYAPDAVGGEYDADLVPIHAREGGASSAGGTRDMALALEGTGESDRNGLDPPVERLRLGRQVAAEAMSPTKRRARMNAELAGTLAK